MANVLPASRRELIERMEQLVSPWTTNAGDIGLTAAQVAAVSADVTAARAAYDNAGAAQSASRAATESYHDAADTLREDASALVKTIKAFAAATNDSRVYSLAEIPQPQSPSAQGAPPTPTNITTSLRTDGSIQIIWKNSDADSATYVIKRKLFTESSFTVLDTAGTDKQYIDSTVPQGTDSVAYLIIAERSGLRSAPSDQTVVQFGSADSEGSEDAPSLTIAA